MPAVAVNILLSYAYHPNADLRKLRRDLVCGRMLIDSGAFTAFTSGKPISLNAYAEYLTRWSSCWDHAITLDVIGDGRATAANTRKLHARGLRVMPVFTRGDSLAEFDAMVRDVGYVCVGGLVGLPGPAQLARTRMLQRRALDQGGGIHALGIGSTPILRAAKPYSADASSASGAFRFGTVLFFDGRNIDNFAVSDRARLSRQRDIIAAHGINVAQLVRTRRMPNQSHGRVEMMQGMSMAYTCADEVIRAQAGEVPPPPGCDGPGTHLYQAMGSGGGKVSYEPDAVVATDRRIHDPNVSSPRLWRLYGSTHRCRATSPERSPANV